MRSILFILCFLQYGYLANAQKLQWVDNGGGTDIKTDRTGRVYATDGYAIIRYSPSGKIIWSKSLNGNNGGISHIGIDAACNVYLEGTSNGNISIGNFSTPGGMFFGKMDSLGNMIWLKTASGASNCRGFYVDTSGNSYFICHTLGVATNAGTINIPGSASSNVRLLYVAKFDSSGKIVWAKPYGNTTGTLYIQNIQIGVDGTGNLYACDGVADYVTIGKATYYNPYPGGEGYSNYLFKISNKGDLSWSKYMDFDGHYGANIAVDTSGNIYLTGTSRLGEYSDSAVFDTIVLKEKNLTSGGETESITVKFDSSGKALWGRHIPGEHSSTGNSIGSSGMENANPPIFLTSNDDVYISGDFEGNIQFGKNAYYFAPGKGGEGFYAKYNNEGLEQGFIPLGYIKKWNLNSGPSGPESNTIALDLNRNIYFTGGYEGDNLFDQDSLIAAYGSMAGKLSPFPIIMPDSIGITYNCHNPYQFSLYYNTTPDSVLWNFGDGTQSHQFQPSHTYSKAGTYIVEVTAYVLAQVKSFSDTITYVIFPSRILPKDTTLCINSILNINCTVPSATSYLWNNGDTMPIRVLNKGGYYKITVSGGGCSESDSFKLVYDSHGYNLGNDTTLCQGDTLVLAGPSWPNDQYLWNTGSTDLLLYITYPDTYWLHVYDGTCHFADTINVKYDLFPSRVLPFDTVICNGRPISIAIKNFSGTILWQDSKTDSDYAINSSGNYSVTLKNQCGTKTYTSTIADSNCDCYLFVPNIFTPNTDHVNDLFYVESACEPITYTLEIYNRWGEKMFGSNDISIGWDGTFKNTSCPPGVYIYKIKYKFPNATEQIKSGKLLID